MDLASRNPWWLPFSGKNVSVGQLRQSPCCCQSVIGLFTLFVHDFVFFDVSECGKDAGLEAEW